MKVVVPDPIDMPEKYISQLLEMGVKIYDDMPKTDDELIGRIKDAEVITANYYDVSAAIIDGAPKLQFIISPAVGYDWIDSNYAEKRGIRIINCPTFNSQAVAEHAISLMYASARKISEAASSLEGGGLGAVFIRWQGACG